MLSGLSSARLVCRTRRMNTSSIDRYKNHRFPVEINSHAVWLYFRCCLSYRDVEELLFARGVTVTYEAIRQWCRKFGQSYGKQLRRQQPRLGDKWHLDERKQTLVARGPYRYVRHTMYARVIPFFAGAPLVLGSWYGMVLLPILVPVLAVRCVPEERMLMAGLDGYSDYLTRVRYRLIRGVC